MTPAPGLCVYCREHPAELKWRPFCSERCRMLDLSRWLGGGYRVAGEPREDLAAEDSHAPIQDQDPD